MSLKENNESNSRPINLVLLAVSFLIFGSLGIVFITQMDLQPGWAWEDLRDTYPIDTYIQEIEDINGNGINEIIGYTDLSGYDSEQSIDNLTRDYGGIFCFEGSTGRIIWDREYNKAVKQIFPIMDIDGDNIKDFFICKASVTPEWIVKRDDESEDTGKIWYDPKYPPNSYNNKLISGYNGSDIADFGSTNFYVHDLISLESIPSAIEDLILLESEEVEIIDGNETYIENHWSITTYFIDGTMKETISNTSYGYVYSKDCLPQLELFHYLDQTHLLFISPESLILLDLSPSNILTPIYELSFYNQITAYEIIEDLNADGISELILSSYNGTVFLVNGLNGEIIREFTIPESNDIIIEEIHTPEGDSTSYVLFNIRYHRESGNEDRYWQIYSFNLISQDILWEKNILDGYEINKNVFILHDDIDGDLIDNLIFFEQLKNPISANKVNRFTISNIEEINYAILNLDIRAETIITINDIDKDGKKDFAFTDEGRFAVISSNKPIGLWLSKGFPFGIPLFIILVALLCFGLIILVLKAKKLKYRRQGVKEHKLTVAVNTLAIILMTVTFLLFLIVLNIFNATLIPNSGNTDVIIAFLLVCIIWYGTLPLTAALYNRFSPQFALIFIKLRIFFFKISKAYKTDIIVLDMREKRDIGLIIQLKRLILPIMLSIAVGFYAYDILTSLLNYPQKFGTFGSSDFFSFIIGYMICCVLPMIISFAIFSFLISGNYLLDDAGVVYYREHKKYRQPGDIEPISIWAQSLIKGIAGFSAIITFTSFLLTVDLSGFFQNEDILMSILGVFVILVMFVGIPFLTGFSYNLLAGEIMEMSVEENVQKLYKAMEKNGYDMTRRDITNIYPSGYESSKRASLDKNNDT